MKKPLLTVMSGLPRSGKTTWVQKNKKSSDIVICPDDIRKDIFGHVFHTEAEPFVWAVVQAMLNILIKQKKDIIIDATSLTQTSRSKYNNTARKNGYKIKLIWIDTPYNICIDRNQKTNKTPIDVLEKMYEMFKSSYFKKDYEKDNFDIVYKIEKEKQIKLV